MSRSKYNSDSAWAILKDNMYTTKWLKSDGSSGSSALCYYKSDAY